MRRQDFWPRRWADLVAWFQNFANQLTTHAATLNITLAQLTQVAADRDLVIACNDTANNSEQYAMECTAFREGVINAPLNTPLPAPPTLPPAITVPPAASGAIQARNRKLVDQIKAHNNYTEAIGQSLGIIGAIAADQDVAINSATSLGASQIGLDLFMAGFSNVAVFRSRGGGGFEQIGISNQQNFTDSAAPLVAGQPETRQYRVQAYVNNQLTGPVSGIVMVVTEP